MDKTLAEQLAMALVTADVVADNFRIHTENCPACAGSFKCQTAGFWVQRSLDATDDVADLQRQLRRASLASR